MHLTAEHWEMCFFLNVSRFLKEHGTGIPIVGGDFNETLMPIDRKSKCKNTGADPGGNWKKYDFLS